MVKHIFIGIGGSGVRTMSEVKYRIYERTVPANGKTRFETMDDSYKFIFVDTDRKDVDAANRKYQMLFEGSARNFIDFTELINLGDENSKQIYQNATTDSECHKVIRESVDEDVVNNIGDFNLSTGASAVRMVSRLAFINKAKEFYEMLKGCIDKLSQDADGLEIKYWVVSSCCGGTGSGVLNDVLYYVNMAKKMVFGDGDPSVGLYLFTPSFYCNRVSGDILQRMRCNAVAVFKELGVLNEWASDLEKSKNIHRFVYSLDGTIHRNKGYRPFDFLIPIDYNNDQNGNLGSQEAMYSTAAEMIFYTHSGNGASGLESIVNNYRLGTFRNSAERYLITIGYSSIRKPVEEFRDYMKLRSRYELLRYGIVGDQFPTVLYGQHALRVFSNQILSAFSDFDREMQETVERELDKNMAIEDDSDNIRYKLPEWMTNNLGQIAVNALNEMANLNNEKGETRKRKIVESIKTNLTNWIEEYARKNGLNYVYGVLLELDEYCTSLYKAFVLGEPSSLLTGIARATISSESVLSKLAGLYDAAKKITIVERLKKDGADIINYVNGLNEWAEARRSELFDNMLTSVLKELSYGDDGLIDKLRDNVLLLKGAAEKECNSAYGDFEALKAKFKEKELDRKTHYLPDVSKFVSEGRWVSASEGNVFAGWYESIVSQINTDKGRVPDRNNDNQHSIEALINSMVTINRTDMENTGYYLGNRSQLFTSEGKQCGRVVEDILNYLDVTIEKLVAENNQIGGEWTNKTIVDLVNDLTTEEQRNLRNSNIPTFFFPNERANTPNEIRTVSFCSTSDNATANKVFQIADDNGCLPADNENVMYRMVAKIGMPYTSYLNYSTYEDTYKKTPNKELAHFHRAFANDEIQLPAEEPNEMRIFLKYLLLDKLRDCYKNIMSEGNGDFDRANCSKTPIIFGDQAVSVATRSAMSVIGDESIELRINRGENHLFDEILINDENHYYVDLYNAFVKNYVNSRYESFVSEFIRKIEEFNRGAWGHNFTNARDALVTDPTERRHHVTSRNEQGILNALLTMLTTTMKTAEQFLN